MVEYEGRGEISADRRLQSVAQLNRHERVHPHFKETLILVKGLRGVQPKHLRQFVANVYGQESRPLLREGGLESRAHAGRRGQVRGQRLFLNEVCEQARAPTSQVLAQRSEAQREYGNLGRCTGQEALQDLDARIGRDGAESRVKAIRRGGGQT